MTNAQLYIAVALPVFAIITSLIISLMQISGIREDMRHLRSEVHTDIGAIREDIRILTGKVYEMMGQK